MSAKILPFPDRKGERLGERILTIAIAVLIFSAMVSIEEG